MIDKKDVIVLLTELQRNTGVNTDDDIALVLKSNTIPLDVLKKINDNRPMDITRFYEKLRKSYNNKKSKLYISIMKSDENVIKEPKTALTTLSALLNQILQFDAEDRTLFYKHARCDEIISVLNLYFKSFDIELVMRLLNLFKADIKVLEMIK